MRGRKPKPSNLKVLSGNPGKRPLNSNEPKPQVRIPSCPAHLNAAARGEWRRIAGELAGLGLLTGVDRAALAAYCQAYGRWVEAERKLKKAGDLTETTTNGNLIQSPLVGIANTAMDLMRKFLVEFGMTPSSRSRISTDPEKTKDKAESYFG